MFETCHYRKKRILPADRKKRHSFLRLLALLLCISLLTGCGMTVGSDRESDAAATYEGIRWDELPRTDIDAESFAAQVVQATALLSQQEAWEQIWAEYTTLSAQLNAYLTQYTLSEIDYYADCTDADLQQRSNEMYAAYIQCGDTFFTFLADILNSDYRQDYILAVGEENALQYEDYTPLTDWQKELIDREDELISEYMELANTFGEASYAALAAQVEPVYLELVQLRNQLAESYGYDSYAAYAYETSYYRSYTPAEVCRLEETVKATLAPVYNAYSCAAQEETALVPYRKKAASARQMLSVLREYLSRMDSALVQSLDTMEQSGFYDIDYRDTKFDTSFTAMLNSVGLPYLFSQPERDSYYYSFSALVHEMGHYNGFLSNEGYASEDYFLYQLQDIDTCEIASNGLELLFMQCYPDIYGEEDAAALQQLTLNDQLSGIVYGCVMDEFQQRVYAEETLQPGQVSEIFRSVMVEYFGDTLEEDFACYWWAAVSHNFEVPFYYISYAMSSLAVLQLWQTAQTDPDTALQTYMQMVSCGDDADFIQLTEAYGLQSVFDENYLQELAAQLQTALPC